jgi:N6-L-threonylcarbamoyladenine synthase
MLGLPYPGGPLVDKHAQKGQPIYSFNKPRVEGLDMSFSGLKTSILNFLKKEVESNPDFMTEEVDNICASVQSTIVEILIDKTREAIKANKVRDIGLAGGVAANSGLRNAFTALAEEMGVRAHIPPFEYCTDNAGMIGTAGYFGLKEGVCSDLTTVANANLPFQE